MDRIFKDSFHNRLVDRLGDGQNLHALRLPASHHHAPEVSFDFPLTHFIDVSGGLEQRFSVKKANANGLIRSDVKDKSWVEHTVSTPLHFGERVSIIAKVHDTFTDTFGKPLVH